MFFKKKTGKLLTLGALAILGIVFFLLIPFLASAFNGPSTSPGIGGGAIQTDSSQNVSVNSSPSSDTKFIIKAPNNLSSNYSFRILSSDASPQPFFVVRNDGKIGIAGNPSSTSLYVGGDTYIQGTLTATALSGSITGTISAANVSSGQFGANTGGGNYSFHNNVGIGTTAPGAKLEVKAGAEEQSGPVEALRIWGPNAPANSNSAQDLKWDFAAAGSAGIRAYRGGSWDTYLQFLTNAAGQGSDSPQVRMTINEAGNVGIGTESPSQKLEVIGNVSSTAICLGGTCNSTWPSGLGGGGTVNYVGKFTGTGTIGNSQIFDNGTNVGIGTTGPGAKLHIRGSQGNLVVNTEGLSSAIGIEAFNDGNTVKYPILLNPWGGGAAVGYTSVGTATLAINGNVGIGTASPSQKLEVIGNVSSTAICLGGTCNSTWPSGGGTPGGSNGAVQFASSTTFGGDATNFFWDNTNKRLGIGTAGPEYKLDVASGGSTTARLGTAGTDTVIIGGGSGKINVGTVDPIYTIGGKQYATYLPGFVGGVREETAGVIHMACAKDNEVCNTNLDFKNAPEGSDLWLFAKATNLRENFDKIVVLLTPSFNGRIWYEKDRENLKLNIFAIISRNNNEQNYPLSSSPEISYRLTAPRFDYLNWPNTTKDQGGFNLDDFYR